MPAGYKGHTGPDDTGSDGGLKPADNLRIAIRARGTERHRGSLHARVQPIAANSIIAPMRVKPRGI